ncbi:unnamed protein product [Euphydryas editha]|uniref:Uncharacterized protein n=1 Tax=Euphydryas editha TaxID=104508 RepID=A0AAU9U834_EUPED|nr:unnamed protein product [Euphydryas editha]
MFKEYYNNRMYFFQAEIKPRVHMSNSPSVNKISQHGVNLRLLYPLTNITINFKPKEIVSEDKQLSPRRYITLNLQGTARINYTLLTS